MEGVAPIQSLLGSGAADPGMLRGLLAALMAAGTRSVGATAARVFLVDGIGANLELAASAGQPGLGEKVAGPVPLLAKLPLTDCMKMCAPVVLATADDWALRYPELAWGSGGSPPGAIACFPLEIEGRGVGVVELVFPLPRSLADADRTALAALARQWESAIEWMQHLHRGPTPTDFAPSDGSRLERLHAFTRALARAITPPDVVDAIVDVGREATAAEMVALWLLSRDGSQVCLARGAGPTPLRPEEYKYIPLSGPPRMAIFDAILNRAPVWIESCLQLEERYPEMAAMFASTKGERSLACVPLFVEGQCIGGLVLKFDGAQRFVEEERAFLQVLAWHSAQAIERSRLYAAEKRAREAA
jgi:GAF domain-containing protein